MHIDSIDVPAASTIRHLSFRLYSLFSWEDVQYDPLTVLYPRSDAISSWTLIFILSSYCCYGNNWHGCGDNDFNACLWLNPACSCKNTMRFDRRTKGRWYRWRNILSILQATKTVLLFLQGILWRLIWFDQSSREYVDTSTIRRDKRLCFPQSLHWNSSS